MPVLERLFWSPAIIDDLSQESAVFGPLETAILERRATQATLNRANVGGWHSDYDLLEWGGEPVRRLRDRVVELANAHCRDIRPEADGPTDWSVTAWANVFEAGDFSMPHAHGGAYWSAIYYLRVDEGDGGELLIHDPRRPQIEMHAPQLRFQPSGGEMVVNLQPKAGQLILLPGWLIHSVSRWNGPGLRISVAINLSAPPARPD